MELNTLSDEQKNDVVDTADCNAFVQFTDAWGERKLLGWAKKLIICSAEAQAKVTLKQLIEVTEDWESMDVGEFKSKYGLPTIWPEDWSEKSLSFVLKHLEGEQ